MKGLLKVAAGAEVVTGLALVVSPSTVTRLLFGSAVASPGPGVARLASFALFALAVACWPTGDAAEGPARRSLLLFSVLCAAYLIYRGIRGGATGPLLWPAAAGHAILGALLAWGGRRAA